MRMREDDHLREEDKADKIQIKKDLKAANDTIVPLIAYVTRQNVRQDLKDEFWRKWGPTVKWIGGTIGTALVGLCLTYGIPAIKTGWAIYQDYIQRHQIKTSDLPPGYVK